MNAMNVHHRMDVFEPAGRFLLAVQLEVAADQATKRLRHILTSHRAGRALIAAERFRVFNALVVVRSQPRRHV